ncbi:MAG: hypothetical protein ACM3S0_20250 [Acidobacteriota bacterium]
MSIDSMTEILSAHADELNSGKQIHKETFLALFPGEPRELESLLDVAARVKRVLKPVKPEPAFRARLHNGLLLAAHHQRARRVLVEKQGEPQWGWLLGAAAIGSAAGLIAVVMRSRAERGQESRTAAVAPQQ